MDASSHDIAATLIGWYDEHARDLPWRARPGSPLPSRAGDPQWAYRVWLSEVMLQQTTTAAVAPYFAAFTARWPTVEALAAADEADVMAAWAGLGYYARARNLIACAREVAARGGAFPQTELELRKLPGLGAYTAAAVAAIAFGQRAVVVDANVERVVARLFAIDDPFPAGRKAVHAMADRITPERRAGDFAQAMMDLGATICTARTPKCALCPLAGQCRAYAAHAPERFPVKPPKKPRPTRTGTAFWVARGDAVWLVRRPAKGMLAGMRALPDDGWNARADGSGTAPLAGNWRPAGAVNHVFTHFALEMRLMVYADTDRLGPDSADGEWWPLANLEQAGLPTLYAKAARLAIAQTGDD